MKVVENVRPKEPTTILSSALEELFPYIHRQIRRALQQGQREVLQVNLLVTEEGHADRIAVAAADTYLERAGSLKSVIGCRTESVDVTDKLFGGPARYAFRW